MVLNLFILCKILEECPEEAQIVVRIVVSLSD